MDNVFIGWSGNKGVADALAQLIKERTKKTALVGGGSPKDMFIGAQVLSQINRCNLAILLVADKPNGEISSNLMFEWGYIMARFPVHHIHSFLLNKSVKDLPSDLMGTWASEVRFDPQKETEADIALKIYSIFEANLSEEPETDYFDLINNWKHIYAYLTDDRPKSDIEICEYVLAGCLAAYYYMDNTVLRNALDSISGSNLVNTVVYFAKAYIDVFVVTENMLRPFSQDDFFVKMQDFDMVLARKRTDADSLELFLDILCHSVYGLTCLLYMRNKEIDAETLSFVADKAKKIYENGLSLISQMEKTMASPCLFQLLRSYMHNDFAHLYQQCSPDSAEFHEHLNRSVEERKALYQTFSSLYPENTFLATKFEQEYIVALSEQCHYMENPLMRKMCENLVTTKFRDWQRELVYTSSLTDRIKQNIEKLH